MNNPAGAANTICASCNSSNAAGARFCGSCGAPLQAGAAAPPPNMPPPPIAPQMPPQMPPMPQTPFGGSRFSMGGMDVDSMMWNAPMPLQPSIEYAARVLSNSGGRVLAQLSPTAFQIEMPYKDFWTTAGMKVAYRGVLNFMPQGPQQTMLQARLSLDWNSAVWVVCTPLVCAVVAGMASQYFFMMWLIFGGLATAVSAWALTGMGTRKASEKLTMALSSGMQPARS